MLNRLGKIVANNLASNERYVMMAAFASPLFAIVMTIVASSVIEYFVG